MTWPNSDELQSNNSDKLTQPTNNDGSSSKNSDEMPQSTNNDGSSSKNSKEMPQLTNNDSSSSKNSEETSNNDELQLINSSNQQLSNDEQSNSDELLAIKYCITFNFFAMFYKTLKSKLTPALVLSLYTKLWCHFPLGKSFEHEMMSINALMNMLCKRILLSLRSEINRTHLQRELISDARLHVITRVLIILKRL